MEKSRLEAEREKEMNMARDHYAEEQKRLKEDKLRRLQ